MTKKKPDYKYCPYCGAELGTDSKSWNRKCDKCNQKIVAPSKLQHYEYKSKLRFFGWPIVHVNVGRNPDTGRPSFAKGIIAIGDMAIGGVAIGGLAFGGLTLGGCGIGAVTMAGFSIGLLFAIGGCAISGGLALGGMAIGSIAVGGGAVGYFAAGGGVYAVHGLGGNIRDPDASQFFSNWHRQLKILISNFGPVIASGILAPIIVIPFLRRVNRDESEFLDGKSLTQEQPHQRSWLGLLACLILGAMFGVGLLWIVAMLIAMLG